MIPALRNNFLFKTYRQIRTSIPPQRSRSLYKNFLAALFRSLLDVLGIFILLPVMNVLVDPHAIEKSNKLHALYTFLHCSSNTQFALYLISMVLFIFILKTIFSWMLIRYQNRFFSAIAEEISMGVYMGVMNETYSYHLNNNTGTLVRNFTNIPFEFLQRILMPFVLLITELLVILIIIFGIFMLSHDILLPFCVVMFVLPFGIIYYASTKRSLARLSSIRDRQSKKFYMQSYENLQLYREILLFKRFRFFRAQFNEKLLEIVHNIRSLNVMNEFATKLIELMAVFCIFAIFLVSFLLGKTEQLTSFLFLFILGLARIIPSLNRSLSFINTIKSTEYTYTYLNNLPPMVDESKPLKIDPASTRPIEFDSKIAVRDLSFQYPGSNRPTLDRISFDIRKGETIGIVGPSGSGKTTLLNILLRLYVEQDGGLYVDEEKIREENVASWYDLIGYVPQNIMITDGTLLENVAFGLPPEKVDMERVWHCIRQASLEALVKESPEGLYTMIGEAGLKISGGQRQRVGIARALYINPQVLIFDEATSALDTLTEETITESIRELSHKDITIIIVAHRVVTLRYCDRIIEIADGRVKREVSYDQLIAG